MKLKTSVSLMVAIVLGLVTAKVGLDMVRKSGPANSSAAKVVVARRDLAPGDVIGAKDVALQEVAEALIPAKASRDLDDVVGRTVVSTVANGQAMFDALMAPKGSAPGLQAMVPPGMRAVTLDVSDSSAVAGMLVRGCKVDVIATLHRGDQTIAKPVVENVVVQHVQRGRSGARTSGGQTTPIDNGPVKTVTLLVTPKQASTIELATAQGGKPRLVLRGNGDSGEAGDGMMTSRELLGEPEPTPVVEAPAPVIEPPPVDNRRAVQIIRGASTNTEYIDQPDASGSNGNTAAQPPARQPQPGSAASATDAAAEAPASGAQRSIVR